MPWSRRGVRCRAHTECIQPACREPIPPLASEPWELLELDDELMEDLKVASLSVVDSSPLNVKDSLLKDNEENDVDTLLAM